MTTNQDEVRGWEEAFDLQFGKAGPDRNSDSIGRRAGCDDCVGNIEIRDEHKAFIANLLAKKREAIEKIDVSESFAEEVKAKCLSILTN